MKSAIKNLLPDSGRKNLSKQFHRIRNLGLDHNPGEDLEALRKKMNLYFKLFPAQRKQYQKELDFINHRSDPKHKFSFILPYEFIHRHDIMKVDVNMDEDAGLLYVSHNGQRLYYSWEHKIPGKVAYTYNNICIEQNENSPHRYLTEKFNVSEGDTVLDIGAAEGNFALDVVERAGRVIIFETDEKWIEALRHTFKPWRDKVEIINKFVGDKDSGDTVTLRTVLNGTKADFIKMDVEGAENSILRSSRDLLESSHGLRLAVCTYHADGDAGETEKILKSCGYECNFSDGYMLFIFSHMKPPYFRKVLMRAEKSV